MDWKPIFKRELYMMPLLRKDILKNKLRYTFLYTDLLAVRIAYDAAASKDLKKLDELEDILEASKVPKEIREASQKLGSRFVKTLMGMKSDWDTEIFHQYLEQRRGKSICHPCAYGVFCACEITEKAKAWQRFCMRRHRQL